MAECRDSGALGMAGHLGLRGQQGVRSVWVSGGWQGVSGGIGVAGGVGTQDISRRLGSVGHQGPGRGVGAGRRCQGVVECRGVRGHWGGRGVGT